MTASVETTLLFDGDVVAYIAAAAAQKVEEDEFGYLRPFANVIEGQCIVDNMILGLMESLQGTHLRVALSDPSSNWRNEIFPDYKSNRKDTVRPLLLSHLKEHLKDEYGAFFAPGLEADDLLGIAATAPHDYEGRTIVVGRDKDFGTIPGLHHTLGDYNDKREPVVIKITLKAANRFHLIQTLAGDRIDGYPGCPGIGMTRAARIIDEPILLVPQEGVVTRGKNKGQSVTKWVSEPTGDLWGCIVSHYRKEGLGEDDALLTARLAHILRDEDFDEETDKITLWTPERITI